MRPTTNCSVKWEIKLIYATELILGSLRSRLNKLQEAICRVANNRICSSFRLVHLHLTVKVPGSWGQLQYKECDELTQQLNLLCCCLPASFSSTNRPFLNLLLERDLRRPFLGT